jgi:hypothetical protein
MANKILDAQGKPLPSTDPMQTIEGQLAFMQMMLIAMVKRAGGKATIQADELMVGGPYTLQWHSYHEPTVHIDLEVLGPDGKPIYNSIQPGELN